MKTIKGLKAVKIFCLNCCAYIFDYEVKNHKDHSLTHYIERDKVETIIKEQPRYKFLAGDGFCQMVENQKGDYIKIKDLLGDDSK